MHSKVIIASLVCMLAATFGNSRISDITKAQQAKAQETSCCNAPNEDGITPGLYSDTPYQNCDFCVFLHGLEYQSEFANHLDVIRKSSSSLNVWTGYDPAYGYYFDVSQPSTDGDYYVTMGSMGRELATLYIHRKNGISYGSVLSKADARAKSYMNCIASPLAKQYLNQSVTQFQASMNGFSVVKTYANYVYGENDMVTTTSFVTRNTGEANTGLTLKIHVDWYADNNAYFARDIPLHFAINNQELTPSVSKKTDSSGNYTVKLSAAEVSGLKLYHIGFGLTADTSVTKVLDGQGINYPYYFKSTGSQYLSSYKQIQYNVKIYPDRGDRAAAYEITQAQRLMSSYVKNFTNKIADKVTTNYPASTTSYVPSIYGQERKINVKKEHYHTWDTLHHEFAHYICDDSELCYISSENNLHQINEDLSIRYGQDLGAKIAYSEGLATFITIAGQIKHAIYSSGDYINVIADYSYTDALNNVSVDYYANKYGQPYSPHNKYVESSVTSVLVKLLFQSYRIGDTGVWSAIMQAGWYGCTIDDFLRELIIRCPSELNDIYTTALSENIYLPDIEPNGIAEWTIMIYMCGSTLEYGQLDGGHATDAIDNILHCPGQPSNVNIIIETGGCSHWCGNYGIPNDKLARYHVRNRHLYLDYTLNKYTGMGEQSTFESFLRWGLNMYPARKTGVIIWNHGGALEGVCQDVLDPGNTLLASETNNALKNIFREKNYSSNYRLEFIGYDACLMQVQDVADYNSNYFKYMVASEEEEVDFMWPYDKWVDDLYANVGADTETLLRAIVDSFVYENRYYGEAKKEQTLSVLDLSKMATYRQKFENLAQRIADCILDASLSDDEMMQRYNRFNMLAADAHQFGNIFSQSWGSHGTNDVYDFLNLLRRDEFFADDLYDVATDLMEFIYPEPIMSGDPNEGEDESLTFGPNARRTLILYKRANYVMHGHWNCHTYGLAMHVMIRDQNQTYPASETRFVKWRYLFTGLRDTIFSIIYS